MIEDFALFLARFILGFFFVIYRFRWIYDPTPPIPSVVFDNVPDLERKVCNPVRQMNLRKKMAECGWGNSPTLAAVVALGEILAGLGLIFGLFTTLSALGMLFILLGATVCTAKQKTMKQNPVDKIDVISCYLWNVEPVYIVLAIVVLALGPGSFSLDALWTYYVS